LRRLLQVSFLVMVSALLAAAAPIACPTGQASVGLPLNTLLTGGVNQDGCFLGDKVFDNFTQTANGGVTAENTVVSFVQSGDIYKVSTTPITPWTSDMMISYAVNVTDPNNFIIVASHQAFFAPAPTSDTVVFGVDPNNGPLMTQTAMNMLAGQQTVQFNGLSATSLISSSDFNPGPLTGVSGQLFSIEQSYVQAIPEPSTLALLGGGLMAFALFRRKRA
jgi:hypothetical protein